MSTTKSDNKQDHGITIGGVYVEPGQRAVIDLPTSSLYTRTPMNITVHVINGAKPGPRLFVTSAVHGDELNGVEIVRRLLKLNELDQLHGTLIAVPIVNIFGFIYRSRYLPDRRDLNRSFPGSKKGSIAARMAQLIMEEIVSQCTHGIDIHTGAIHRRNMPQVRGNLKDPNILAMAKAFGVPVLISGSLIAGSLRSQAKAEKVHTILYEAGEALRISFTVPVEGEPPKAAAGDRKTPVKLGTMIEKDQLLAIIADPITGHEFPVNAPYKGMVIGVNKLPLVNEGDALLHIARTASGKSELLEENI